MDKALARPDETRATFNPTARFNWLSAPAKKAKARWLFSKRQTKMLFWLLLGIAAIAAVMIWPVLPVNSPAWPVYWLHDTVISPIIGRIFLRYSPYPELIIASFVMLALFALYARSYAGDMHRLATYKALKSGWFKRVLLKWAKARKTDSYLPALAERRFREYFEHWLGSKHPKDYNMALEAGNTALLTLSNVSANGDQKADMAMAAIAARLMVMQRIYGKPWPSKPDTIMKVLSDDGRDICAQLLSLFAPKATVAAGEEELLSLWTRGKMWPESDRTQYWETICWLALVHGLRHADSFLLRHFLKTLAEYGFMADVAKTRGRKEEDTYGIDPSLWLCAEADISELGSGPGTDALATLRGGLLREAQQ